MSDIDRAKTSRRATSLAALVLLQAFCSVFFVADVLSDFQGLGPDFHTLFEGLVALALVSGTVMTALTTRTALEETRRTARALSMARGALGAVLEDRFARWGLTPAEADVAMFAVKGLEVADIAALRGSAAGTIRAQLASVYRKAGVANRSQLVSLFIEDLVDDPVTTP